MAISHQENGTAQAAQTAPTISYPVTGLSANDLFVLFVICKLSDTVAATGFTRQITNVGGDGGGMVNGAGDVRVEFWTKVATGSETGNIALSKTTETGTVIWGQCARFRNATGVWESATTGGQDSDGTTTAASITGAADIGCVTGDFLCVVAGGNDNATAMSSEALSVAGCTMAAITQMTDGTSSLGNDINIWAGFSSVSSGTSSGAPTWSGTQAVSGLEWSGAFLRIREGAAASTVVQDIIGIGIVPFAR